MVCAVLWGSAFPAIKSVFAHWEAQGVTVGFETRALFAGVRFMLAGIALLIMAKCPGREWRATPLRWIWFMAATQTVGQYVCFYLGLSLSSGALSSLLVSSGSFWWVILSPRLLGTPDLTGRQWAILTIGALGVTLAVYSPGVTEGSPRLGGLLILIASLFGALGLFGFHKVKPTMGSRAATGFSLFLGGVVLVGLGGPAIWAGQLGLFDGYVLAWTVWLAFVSAAAFSLWNHLSTIFPAPTLATYRFLIPLCGVVESLWLLDDERLSPGIIIGGTLVLIAMTVSQTSRDRKSVETTV